MYLEHDVKFTANDTGWCRPDANTYINICSNYGSNLIKECELEIGGQRIDKHYSHWHSVYSQLTEFNPTGADNDGITDGSSSEGARSTLFNTMSGNGGAWSPVLTKGPRTLTATLDLG